MSKSLFIGIFEVRINGMGSGANSFTDTRLVPATENDILDSVLMEAHPHSRGGIDALKDAFWLYVHEIEQMLDSSTKWCARIAKHKPLIPRTIKTWYNGYYIGRFHGKYNIWSISSYFEDP
ncbi:hypothetical protein GGI18_002830 [Coemansia linderi]|uniref:Uncharacterized protein n=1 Tax=Coemansia linderi TaxID=2663919 RepID=A0ACC1KEN5_9FUNG|nr:hypothetical protein GGI18_002830 [Coemansia linderi]